MPWLTSILLADIFARLAVLAVHLLVFADGTLRRLERIALVALIAFAMATHSATFAVVVALLAAAALAWWYLRIGSASGIARRMAAAALDAAMLVSANYVVTGKLAWTPGGIALSFGRIHQPGRACRHAAAPGHRPAGLAPRTVRRSGHPRRHGDGCAARQCLRLRRVCRTPMKVTARAWPGSRRWW